MQLKCGIRAANYKVIRWPSNLDTGPTNQQAGFDFRFGHKFSLLRSHADASGRSVFRNLCFEALGFDLHKQAAIA